MTVPIADTKSVWIDALAECESQGNPDIPPHVDTNGYYSYGLLQFQLSTWLKYGKDFGATRENIHDGELQKAVARDMLDNGGRNHWYNCAKVVERTLGTYK